MSCSVGCRQSLDLGWLWLRRRPAAAAPIQPLAQELPYAMCAALKKDYINKGEIVNLASQHSQPKAHHTAGGCGNYKLQVEGFSGGGRVVSVCFLFLFFLSFFFFFFRAAPVAYGGSQARGQIGTAAGSLYHSHSHSHSHTGSERHLLPTPQLAAMLDPLTH